jgi:hydrogenase/urease accessory protein HupE
MRALLAALILLAAIPAASGARAHALDPAYLELSALDGERWRATWRKPDVGGRQLGIEAVLPQACAPRRPPPARFDGQAWSAVWIADCPGGLAGGRIAIEGLADTPNDALVRYELAPDGEGRARRLTPGAPEFRVPGAAGAAAVLTSYAALGVDHILQGVDHLLFVFALLLLVPDARRLVAAVTAFTAAHSLSLAAAALGWIVVPAPPVEAVVALSIVFLAAELARPPEARDRLSERSPWIVAFGFGLLHGLGFARGLVEVGLPEGDVPLALFAFNIGVEIGQLLFIATVIAVAASLRRLYPALMARASAPGGPTLSAAGHAMGALAAFWVIDRTAAFF